jgi:hypothetical protein
MEKGESDLDSLHRELAGRFRGLSRLFAELGSQEGAQKLLDSLISGDAAAFNRLIEPVEIPDLPQLGKCFWVREIIDRVSSNVTFVEVCLLRDDLTPDERALYLSIARRHGALIPLTDAEKAITVLGDGEGIPPGPFLDELKANGLVTCNLRRKYDVSTNLAFGKPERICV